MPFYVRKASVNDAGAIAQLSAQLGYGYSTEKTVLQIAAVNASTNDVAFVALEDENIVGWVHVFYTIRLECDSYCEIAGLVVNAKHRGKGAGKLLVGQAIEWCKAKNCTILMVRSNVVRKEAHLFYVNSGFMKVKQQEIFEMHL